jgi:general secretion pathway protein H
MVVPAGRTMRPMWYLTAEGRNRPDPSIGSLQTHRESGFTLLEILIVLVIVAMAATLIGPSLDAGSRAREIRSTARLVAGTLKGLQSRAIQSGRIQTLVIRPRENFMAVVSSRAEVALGNVAGILDLRGGDPSGNGDVSVNFYPNGASSGLTLLIGDRERPADGGFFVGIDPLIGIVTVRDHIPGGR